MFGITPPMEELVIFWSHGKFNLCFISYIQGKLKYPQISEDYMYVSRL